MSEPKTAIKAGGGRYRTIVADPPWHYERTGVSFVAESGGEFTSSTTPYDSLTVAAIKALPVRELSDNVDEDAHLYLWTTSRYLPDAFSVVDAWGFHYAATLVWCKPSRGWSIGGTYQNNVEGDYILDAGRVVRWRACREGRIASRSERVLRVLWQTPTRLTRGRSWAL